MQRWPPTALHLEGPEAGTRFLVPIGRGTLVALSTGKMWSLTGGLAGLDGRPRGVPGLQPHPLPPSCPNGPGGGWGRPEHWIPGAAPAPGAVQLFFLSTGGPGPGLAARLGAASPAAPRWPARPPGRAAFPSQSRASSACSPGGPAPHQRCTDSQTALMMDNLHSNGPACARRRTMQGNYAEVRVKTVASQDADLP